jgi:hypothetical protein
MANNPHFGLGARNAMLNVITACLGNSALFIIYSGAQPADASAAVTAGNVSVARLAFTESSAFAAATAGAITANSITSDSGAAGGSANWFSLEPSSGDGTGRKADGEVGTSSSDLNLNSQTITTGATVSVTGFQITLAA